MTFDSDSIPFDLLIMDVNPERSFGPVICDLTYRGQTITTPGESILEATARAWRGWNELLGNHLQGKH